MTDQTLVAHVIIPGDPYSQGRPRVTKHGTFMPKNTREHTAKVREVFQAAEIADYDHAATFRLDTHFYLGTRRHSDNTNLTKLVEDALNKVAYEDDWRIYSSRIEKYHTTKARARTELFLYTINPDREEAA